MLLIRVLQSVALSWAVSVGIQAALAQQTPLPFTDSKTVPETPAAKRAMEALDVLNADNGERTAEFIRKSCTPQMRDAFPMDEHVAVFSQIASSNGGFEFYGFRQYDPPHADTHAVLIMRGKLTESWNAIVVDVAPEPPHLIAGLNFAQARPPKDLPAGGKLTKEQALAELKTWLERMADKDVFSGAVLLAKDGKPLFTGAYGQANKDFNAPNKPDTKFNLGSMNKMFTGVAVAQLAERGKLSFDDPISKYLSTDWLPREVADKITVEHLLTHTSGLGSYFSDKFMNSSRELYRKVDDYKPLVAEERPQFEPGTQSAYSNTGMLVLGAVIEKASGQDYFEYIRANIYQPAGMTNSDCYELDRVNPNLAVGYSKERGADGKPVYVNNVFKHVIRGGPAGGGYSTVEDLLRFDQALRSGKLVKAETREQMWSPKPHSPNYGYGFGLQGGPGNLIVGHTGGFPGISSSLEIHVDGGWTVVVLSNYDRGSQAITNKINELLRRIE